MSSRRTSIKHSKGIGLCTHIYSSLSNWLREAYTQGSLYRLYVHFCCSHACRFLLFFFFK